MFSSGIESEFKSSSFFDRRWGKANSSYFWGVGWVYGRTSPTLLGLSEIRKGAHLAVGSGGGLLSWFGSRGRLLFLGLLFMTVIINFKNWFVKLRSSYFFFENWILEVISNSIYCFGETSLGSLSFGFDLMKNPKMPKFYPQHFRKEE